MRKLVLAVLAFGPALALASGFEVINTNPRDLAMSHSLVAAQQDAAATLGNPAALSKLDGLNLSLAGTWLGVGTQWTAPSGDPVLKGSAETKSAPVYPVSLFGAYGTQVNGHGVGVGVGVGVPAGGQVRWPEDWQGRGRIITVERRMLGFYGNVGYEVLPWLRVGAGGIYYYLNQYFKQGIQNSSTPDAFAELKTSGGALAFQLSAEAQPIDGLTIGVDYKHQGVMKTTGDGHFSAPPALQNFPYVDQGVSEHLTFPNLLAVGVAWRVTKPVLVTLQYNYSRFQSYQEDDFVGDTGIDIVVPRRYSDGHVIRGGVEWSTSDKLTLRAGAMRDMSGFNSDAYSPTLPDSHTTGFSVGGGWTFFPGLAVNAALFYGDRDKVTVTGTTAFPGSYKTDVWIASLGLVWATGVGASK